MVQRHRLDLYRHDFNAPLRGQWTQTVRDGFLESDYWRYYEAFGAIFARIRAKHPDLILQQASCGGTRLDLATAAGFHEHYTCDKSTYPYMFQMASGLSVYLPPEILVTPIGMRGPDQPDFITMLRAAYAIGHTPLIFNAMLPRSVDEFEPGVREAFEHYSELYKRFIRPLLPTCRVYHHAPVNATGGVETGDWFAMQFTAPDAGRGWATIVRLTREGSGTYLFRPRGLDRGRRYRVTFDNCRQTTQVDGSQLAAEGLSIELAADPSSELILFEA